MSSAQAVGKTAPRRLPALALIAVLALAPVVAGSEQAEASTPDPCFPLTNSSDAPVTETTAPTGAGSSGDPYLITSKEELVWVSWATSDYNTGSVPTKANARKASYKQTANIDMAGCNFRPIGLGTQISLNYDGGGHVIDGLKIVQTGVAYVGMFAWAQQGAAFRDLGLTNVDITGGQATAGLVGRFRTFDSNISTITGVFVSGTVTGNGSLAVGGLVGDADGGANGVQIRNSYAKVDVSNGAHNQSGGLIGRFTGAGSVLENTFSVGSVSSGGGGLVGSSTGTFVDTENFWDTVTSGIPSTSAAGVGKTTAEMKDPSTFAEWGIVEGWEPFDFSNPNPTNYWGICVGSDVNQGYPFLLWQFSTHPCPAPDPGPSPSPAAAQRPAATPTAPIVRPQQSPAPASVVPGPVLAGGVVPAPPRDATVLVGGVPAVVEQTTVGSSTLSIRAGTLTLGVTVPEGQGGVTTESGVTQLAVKNGSATTLAGAGLLPGATVQVFIPLAVDDARELFRIIVDADGTFSAEAPFSSDPLADPLPIGPRLLQLVSVDEDGNQVVIDMTVNIEQSDPSPALNREEGDLPALSEGVSLVTSAGLPVEARVSALEDRRSAVVEGDDWSMAVNLAGAGGSVTELDSGAVLTLVRDEAALVAGSGFMAGTRADVWLFSEPTLLGTVTIDENGEFAGEVDIDPDLIPAGNHTLQLQGVGVDGYVKAANLGVLVEDSASPLPVAEVSEPSFWFLWWIVAALVVVALVVLWIVVRRRRSS